MKILFATLPGYGHIYPVMPLVQASASAGHEVVVATGEPFLDRLPVPTVPGIEAGCDISTAMARTPRLHPQARGFDFGLALFGDVAAGLTMPALQTQLERWKPDLVIYETTAIGAGVLADVMGIPAAMYGINIREPFVPQLTTATVAFQAHEWTRRGLPVPTDALLGRAYLDPFPPGLHSHGLGADRVGIRQLPWSQPGTPASLPPASTRRRLVWITLGTVVGTTEVLRRIIAGLRTLDVEVLVSAGPSQDPAALAPIPPNVQVERLIAPEEVLPHVDVVVHHGGGATMLNALIYGIPQLVVPHTPDTAQHGAALAAAGAGQLASVSDLTPDVVGGSVESLLSDGPERTAAAALRDEILAMPAPAEVVDVLEELARS